MPFNLFYVSKNKSMKTDYQMIVGIDISKRKLDVWFMAAPGAPDQKHFVVSNDADGIRKIISSLEQLKINPKGCLFCFENTGMYGMPLCYELGTCEFDYWVVPSLEIKRSKGISRGKSDRIDAKDIAIYAHVHRHKMVLSKLPQKELIELKLLFTERDRLVKVIKMMERTVENETFLPEEVLSQTIALNKETVKLLKNQLEKLEKTMMELVKKSPEVLKQVELVKSVPGVGIITALCLVLKTNCFTSFDNWRQLACYSGVAPFEHTSGTSVKGRTRVNHLADKKLKSILQMCVLSAIRHDREMGDYYQRKKAEGKNGMLVMNNVRCKILARVFAVINRGTPFINIQKFAA